MEDTNYRNDFEFFLKENADEYRMVPSRKIWYSLYNNMHPDRKWPSVAVCLLILTAVLYIGVANNNAISSAAKKAASQNFSAAIKENTIDKKTTSKTDNPSTSTEQTLPEKTTSLKMPANEQAIVNSSNESNNPKSLKSTLAIVNNETSVIISNNNNTRLVENIILDNTEATAKIENAQVLTTKAKTTATISTFNADDEDAVASVDNATVEVNSGDKKLNTKLLPVENNALRTALLNVEKSWKEDYAFRNKPVINKFKQNASLSYYITPSSGYRSFVKKGEKQYTGSSLVVARGNNDDALLVDDAALNLEAGAVVQYNVAKNIKLKAGVQTNYTNYVSHVTALGHPSQTYLSLANGANVARSSNYTTKAGNDRINKTTVQVSLPVGADVKIAGKRNLKWYAGATIQPSYVISGSAFVLSADEKYYISETPLLRKMNLNTGIETYLSFRSFNGVTLSVGPQFRYQLLSTYKNDYNYSEKAYNIGVKVGITTSF
ncbi:MAG: hypothetical protein ACKVOM_04925 [Ferruginibacter sp.]